MLTYSLYFWNCRLWGKLINFFFQLEVNGYNEKQEVFLQKIVNKIVNFEVDAKRFKVFKQKVNK